MASLHEQIFPWEEWIKFRGTHCSFRLLNIIDSLTISILQNHEHSKGVSHTVYISTVQAIYWMWNLWIYFRRCIWQFHHHYKHSNGVLNIVYPGQLQDVKPADFCTPRRKLVCDLKVLSAMLYIFTDSSTRAGWYSKFHWPTNNSIPP